ncbi:MAG: cation transporter [Lachnospiraceae bacterium]|nr:cation transporter [Lachnospiraceae bacterium]
MTSLLVRWFVKDNEKVQQPKVRKAYGILASVVGICCNVLLFAAKLVGGLMLNSISVLADAFNNLSDAASSLVSLVGVQLAGRPADEEHPFGHGRYEYIAALVVAFLIIEVGFSCLKNAVTKIFHPEELRFQLVVVILLCLSILVKLWLASFNRKLGKKINSKVMQATAADATGDVLVTGATVLSLVIGRLAGIYIDGYMGAIVSVVVLLAGLRIAKDTLEPLLGEAIDREVYEQVTQKVESYEGIVGSHDLIVHNYGPSHLMATIHAELPNTMEIEAAHELVDRIEREVLRDMNLFLVIHMDPVEVNDLSVAERKRMVAELVRELEPAASIHDFRMINGEEQINLIFDLVLPYSYKADQEAELLDALTERLHKIDARYACVITLENSFIQAENKK